ncbi:hypothetical protein NSER024013_12600 [Nocardia seriolae]|nr:hypothetical protein NSER024013_12600 [Nocardia seriolae]
MPRPARRRPTINPREDNFATALRVRHMVSWADTAMESMRRIPPGVNGRVEVAAGGQVKVPALVLDGCDR